MCVCSPSHSLSRSPPKAGIHFSFALSSDPSSEEKGEVEAEGEGWVEWVWNLPYPVWVAVGLQVLLNVAAAVNPKMKNLLFKEKLFISGLSLSLTHTHTHIHTHARTHTRTRTSIDFTAISLLLSFSHVPSPLLIKSSLRLSHSPSLS